MRILCTVHFTVHHCTQNCNKPAVWGCILPKSNTIYPSCAKHRKDEAWMKELGGKWYPIKKAIHMLESR